MLTKEELEEFQNKLLDRRVQIEKNLRGTALELEGMRGLDLLLRQRKAVRDERPRSPCLHQRGRRRRGLGRQYPR